MLRLHFPLLIALLAVTACGSGDSGEDRAPAASTSGSEVGSIAIDPADGMLLAGSGPVFYRVPPGAKTPETPKGAIKTTRVKRSSDGGVTWGDVGTIGSGPREFVVTPKGELYASVAGGEIRRSTDGGATWTKVITLG